MFNKINSKFYVGSSINIRGRIKNYLNRSYLKSKKNLNMPIVKALLKYGYTNFALIIIEYNNEVNISERETWWISKLNPYYNILKKAYRSTGYKYSEEIKTILSSIRKGKKHSTKTKLSISNSLIGIRNPFYMRKHSFETKKLISRQKSKGIIYLYDDILNLLVGFPSLTKLAKLIFSSNKT